MTTTNDLAAFDEEAFDRRLAGLFADVRPAPGLEDRMITGLREARSSWIIRHPALWRVASVAAAAVFLAGVGAFWEQFINSPRAGDSGPQVANIAYDRGSLVLADSGGGSVGGGRVRDEDNDYRQPDVNGRIGRDGTVHDDVSVFYGYLDKSGSGEFNFRSGQAGEGRVAVGKEVGSTWDRSATVTGGTPDNAERGRGDGRRGEKDALAKTDADADNKQGKMQNAVRLFNGQLSGFFSNTADSSRTFFKVSDLSAVAKEGRTKEETEKLANQAEELRDGAEVTKLADLGRKDEPSQPGSPPTGPSVEPAAGGSGTPQTNVAAMRKIIRSGELEFEVESFDSAAVQVNKIVAEQGGFVSSTSSEKLPNGKVKGTIVARVAPERLDALVLSLRALGDLKTQRIGAQDVTKHYTDMDSELRAARAMETRLLEIIKSPKGEVKDLLEAEKQLGTWREKIEKLEGEIRYYNNLIALSTLSISLFERDIKTPTAASEQETVNMGMEADDIEKSYEEAKKAVGDAKGRIISSDLKRHDAGQLTATIECAVPPDAAGPLIDRLKQIGRVSRLSRESRQTTQGGSGAPSGVRVERKETRFLLSLYNLANVQARETTNLSLAVQDVEAAYRQVLALVEQQGADKRPIGRVVSSSLNRARADQITGVANLEVAAAQAQAILEAIRAKGEVMELTVTENPDTQNVTRAKQGFNVRLVSPGQVQPRDTYDIQAIAPDVAQAYAKVLDLARQSGRVISCQLSEANRQNVSGTIAVDLGKDEQAALEKALDEAAQVHARVVTRSADQQNATEKKARLQITLGNSDRLAPREQTKTEIEVSEVEASMDAVASAAQQAAGGVAGRHLDKDASGRIRGIVVVDVPLGKADAVRSRILALGNVRRNQSVKDPSVPEGRYTRARFDVTLVNADRLVPGDQGLGASLKSGLATSAEGLLWSLKFLVVGICVVVPWLLVFWGGWKVFRRRKAQAAS